MDCSDRKVNDRQPLDCLIYLND